VDLLFRYVLREYLKVFVLIAAALLPIAFVIHLLEKGRKMAAGDADWSGLLRYFFYRLPDLVADLFPLVMLLATLTALHLFRRSGEMTAFFAVGVSRLQFALPILMFGLGVSAVLLLLGGTLIPHALKRAREIDRATSGQRGAQVSLAENRLWFLASPREIWNIQMIEADATQMHGLHLFLLGNDFSLREEVEAKTLTRHPSNPESGLLHHGVRRTFSADGNVRVEPFLERPVKLPAFDFRQLEMKPDEMTTRQLRSYIDELSAADFDMRRYAVDLAARQAFPFANGVMIWLAVALAAQGAARQMGIAVGLALGIGYWFVYSATLSLGRSGSLPPTWAAWSANLIYLGVGLILYIRRPV